MKARVAVLRVEPATVLAKTDELFELSAARHGLDEGAATILHPDVSWHFPFPSVNTTPWQLQGVILGLQRRGFNDLSFVQSSDLTTDPEKTRELNVYASILNRYNVPALSTANPHDTRWLEYRPRTPLRVLHTIFPAGILVPEYFIGKNVVHLPTLKCHAFATLGGAMLASFTALLSNRRTATMPDLDAALVDVLAIERELCAGGLCFADGTTAGNGAGPRTVEPVQKNVVLASQSSVALDAVAARLMGFDPLAIPYLRLAQESGLGVADPRDIELVGDDISHECWGFSCRHNGITRWGDALWRGPLKRTRLALLRGPLVNALALGSEIYYDAYRWRSKDRAIFESWKHDNPWGQLFAAYERGEFERQRLPEATPGAGT